MKSLQSRVWQERVRCGCSAHVTSPLHPHIVTNHYNHRQLCCYCHRCTRVSHPAAAVHPLPPCCRYSMSVFAGATRGLEVTGSNQLTGVCYVSAPASVFLCSANCPILVFIMFSLAIQIRPTAEASISVHLVRHSHFLKCGLSRTQRTDSCIARTACTRVHASRCG